MDSLSEANTHFALDLFQQFKLSKKNDNIFYSPLSITSALAMTYLGARENTALEIGKVGVSCLHTDQLRRISPLAWVQMTTNPAVQHRRLGKHSHNWVSTELWGAHALPWALPHLPPCAYISSGSWDELPQLHNK